MNTRNLVMGTLLATALVVSGCGKKSYGAGCEKAAELTAPWTELSLPIDAKKTRVCASSASELKLRSHEWTTKTAAQSAMEAAVTAAGYTKDKCSGAACYYVKDGKRVAVQPMNFKVKKKKLTTISLRMGEATAKR